MTEVKTVILIDVQFYGIVRIRNIKINPDVSETVFVSQLKL